MSNPLQVFLTVFQNLALFDLAGVVLVWAATKFKYCTVPLSPPVEGARSWVLGSAMYVKSRVINAKDGQDRRRDARAPLRWLQKRRRTRVSSFQ
jgi:hypothetical protein